MDLTLTISAFVITAICIGFVIGSWWQSQHDPDGTEALQRSNHYLRMQLRLMREENDQLRELTISQRRLLRTIGCELGGMHEELFADEFRSRPARRAAA